MKEILFRGKNNNNGEWVYGFLMTSRERPGRTADFIIKDDGECNEPHEWILLKPETIGQYIGLNDKNGKKIFEGDIVNVPEGYGGDYFFKESIGYVKYDDDRFTIETESLVDYHWNELEVIGNIHDNPELLED